MKCRHFGTRRSWRDCIADILLLLPVLGVRQAGTDRDTQRHRGIIGDHKGDCDSHGDRATDRAEGRRDAHPIPLRDPRPVPPMQYGEGRYVVGVDIKTGTYHTSGADIWYWARLC